MVANDLFRYYFFPKIQTSNFRSPLVKLKYFKSLQFIHIYWFIPFRKGAVPALKLSVWEIKFGKSVANPSAIAP